MSGQEGPVSRHGKTFEVGVLGLASPFFVDGEMPEKSFLGLCCTLPGEVFADESGYHS